MVSLGFPAILLAYICKLILYYFKVANNKKKFSSSSQPFSLPNGWLSFFPLHPIPFQGHIFHAIVDLIDTHSLFLVSHFGFQFLNNDEVKRATVSHFFRYVGKICFEELDWTTPGDLQWQTFLAGWLFVSFLDRLVGVFVGFSSNVTYSVPWSSLFKLKSSTNISWCSSQPRRPKCSVGRV